MFNWFKKKEMKKDYIDLYLFDESVVDKDLLFVFDYMGVNDVNGIRKIRIYPDSIVLVDPTSGICTKDICNKENNSVIFVKSLNGIRVL